MEKITSLRLPQSLILPNLFPSTDMKKLEILDFAPKHLKIGAGCICGKS